MGVLATRKQGNHLALFFVAGEYHRQGIGKKLFATVKSLATADTITVNSSPYAVKIYRKLGFSATDSEQVVNGLSFIPMKYDS